MADTIIESTQFNAECVKYTSPKIGSVGGKSVNILNRKTNSRLNISTPVMLTWGASDFVDPQTGKGNGKFEMALQFPTEEYASADTTAFLENMQKFEQKIKTDALTYSKEWLGKVHKSSDVVDALYSPFLKYSKDKSTGEPDTSKPPSIRIKIPIWEGEWKCSIYSEEGVPLFPNENGLTPVDLIPKATQVKVLMTCGGIWFANGKFGITWKLIQAMVQKPRQQLTGQCFLKINPSPVRPNSPECKSPVQTAISELNITDVNDTDSEVDEEENHSSSVIAADPEFGVTEVLESQQDLIIESTASGSGSGLEPKKARKVVKKKSTKEDGSI